MKRRLVFDVESVGLHGEGFAVGYVLLLGGHVADEAWAYCAPSQARGTEAGRAWIREHCAWAEKGMSAAVRSEHGLPSGTRLMDPRNVRDWFWARWAEQRLQGAELWADVAWPVEARFLGQCVEDVREEPDADAAFEDWAKGRIPPTPREWEGPYPLLDVRSYVEAIGIPAAAAADPDPVLVDEQVVVLAHHPLVDARLSAEKLLRVERMLKRALPSE